MILVISFPQDPHAAAVMAAIAERGVECHLLDLAEFPRNARLDCRYGVDGTSITYRRRDGQVIDLTRARAAWWRRPQPFTFEHGVDATAFAHAECEDAVSGLWQALDARWINPPIFDQAAHHKTYQLKLATALGLDPPDTLVTNSPQSAAAFVARHEKVVYKPFAGSAQYWRETRMFGEEEQRNLALLRHAPVILQDFIPGQDYRVTVIAEHVFAALVDASAGNYALDFRMNRDVKITEAALPPALLEAIHVLMGQLHLVYGALDFRLDSRDGRFRFLEINPAGQWLFVESQTGQPIARTLADQLIALAA